MKLDRSGLTFHWPDSRHVSFALPAFIVLSLFAHAVSFYIFQITYPPSAYIAPPPAQVSLLTANSPENESLLRWIEAEDPAIAAKPPEVVPENLLTLDYKPSFTQVRAQPKTIPEAPQNFAYPPARSPLALIESALPHEAVAEPAQTALHTTIHFSGALENRNVTKPMPLEFHSSATELQPARFLIGVSGRGEVRYVFLQASSGDKAIDEQAESQLRKSEFSNASEAIIWGMATFSWGADAFNQQ